MRVAFVLPDLANAGQGLELPHDRRTDRLARAYQCLAPVHLLLEPGKIPVEPYLPVMDQGDAVADPLHLVQVVRAEKDTLSPFLDHAEQRLADVHLSGRVDAGRRLIEDQQIGVM